MKVRDILCSCALCVVVLFVAALVASPVAFASGLTFSGDNPGAGEVSLGLGTPAFGDTELPIVTNVGSVMVDFTSGPIVSSSCDDSGNCGFTYGAGGSITLKFQNGATLTGSFLDGSGDLSCGGDCAEFTGDFTLDGFIGEGSVDFGDAPSPNTPTSISHAGTPETHLRVWTPPLHYF
jgi:hypothetical protein